MAISYPSPPHQPMFVYMDYGGYYMPPPPPPPPQQQQHQQQAYLAYPQTPTTETLTWPAQPSPPLSSCSSWYSWPPPARYEIPTPPFQSYPEADSFCDAKQVMVNTSDEEEVAEVEHPQWQPAYPSRPHECEYCSRSFSRRHDLDRHRRTHTGVKPYVCPCCFKAFPRSDARGRHFRNEPACRNGPQVLAFIKKNVRNTI